jgi:hypothetical protein
LQPNNLSFFPKTKLKWEISCGVKSKNKRGKIGNLNGLLGEGINEGYRV